MRQVNELLRHTVSELINREIELPLDSFVTITRVETTRDLKHATIYVTVIPDGKRVSTMKQLQGQKRRVQRELGKRIEMKYTPKLRFKFDQQQIKAQGVYDALDSEPSS